MMANVHCVLVIAESGRAKKKKAGEFFNAGHAKIPKATSAWDAKAEGRVS